MSTTKTVWQVVRVDGKPLTCWDLPRSVKGVRLDYKTKQAADNDAGRLNSTIKTFKVMVIEVEIAK